MAFQLLAADNGVLFLVDEQGGLSPEAVHHRKGDGEEVVVSDTVLKRVAETRQAVLTADAILDCSRRGDLVLDGFAGSGTTLLAAQRTGRIGYGLEIDPLYVDVTVRRMAEHAGLEAVHVETGKSFDEIAAQPLVLFGSTKSVFAFEDIVLEPLGPSAGQPFLDRP